MLMITQRGLVHAIRCNNSHLENVFLHLVVLLDQICDDWMLGTVAFILQGNRLFAISKLLQKFLHLC